MIQLIVALVVGIVAIAGGISSCKDREGLGFGIGVAILILAVILSGIRVVAPGEVGVKVLLGSMSDKHVASGLKVVMPGTSIIKYSVRQQAYIMSATAGEGQIQGNDSIRVMSEDDLQMHVDLTIRYELDGAKVPWLHEHIGKDYEAVLFRPMSRDVARAVFGQFTGLDAATDKRSEVAEKIQEELSKALNNAAAITVANEVAETENLDEALEILDADGGDDYGIRIVGVDLRDVIPPQTTLTAIESKITRQQEVEQKKFEQEVAEADAKIALIEAEGLKSAQDVINETLTPLYVQHEAIEAIEALAGSPNTTFYIVPMNPEGAGLPLILSPSGTGKIAAGG